MSQDVHRTPAEEFRDNYGMDPGFIGTDPVTRQPSPETDPYMVDGEMLAEIPTDPAIIEELAAEYDNEGGWRWDL